MHELNRILFDALEKSIAGTEYDQKIDDLFFGLLDSVITCSVCGQSRVKTDRFLDLGLQVRGCKSVEESLNQLFTFEEFTGDNQLICDNCNGIKTDSKKGVKISKMSPTLTLCLYRFELDYETWQRRKLDDKFTYPMEIDMSKYMTDDSKKELSEDELIYELKSIVVHSGSAHGGHYYAYAKDDMNQGNHYLEVED